MYNTPTSKAGLYVNVAEWACDCSHSVLNLDARCIDAQLDDVLQSAVPTRRAVVEREGPRDGVLSGLDILVLPDPPRAVDLAVVKEEPRGCD